MITLIKHSKKSETYKSVDENALCKMLKSDGMKVLAEAFRKEYVVSRARGMENDEHLAFTRWDIAKICFAGEWKKANRRVEMKHSNALVLLEINNLRSKEDAIALREEAARHPYTYMAFVGLSGFSVKIVCKMNSNLDFETMQQPQLEQYQLNAYKHLHYIYSSQLGLSVDNLSPDLNRTCMLSYDEDMYYNPNSEALFVSENDAEVPVYKGNSNKNCADDKFEISSTMSMGTIFEWCLRDATEKARTEGYEGDTLNEAILSYLANYCNDSGLPVDYAILHTRWKSRFEKFHTDYITNVFTNAYEEMESLSIPYRHVNKQALMAYKSEAFLNLHYELRRNVITGVVQYRKKNGFDYNFHNLTEQVMNSMTHDAIKQGIGSWDKDMKRIVNSDRVPLFDPISSYLYSLPAWDGKDRVSELANRIPSDCPDKEFYLHTWLLSMVAHWLGKDSLHGNALVPILIGGQGCGKTSFCGVVLPPQLRDYYNDKVEFKNETSLVLGLSSFALINIDEFDALKKSQQPTLKYLLSKSDVKLRLPYGKAFEQRRRYASFIATTNNPHPLVDRTGSRRFVCIKVIDGKRVDFLTPINYEQLYAQLHNEVYSGKQYWLDEAQTTRLMEYNKAFMVTRTLPEMLALSFTLPLENDKVEVLTSYDVINILMKRFPEFNPNKGTSNEIGKYFNAHGFVCKKRNTGALYHVKIVNKSTQN